MQYTKRYKIVQNNNGRASDISSLGCCGRIGRERREEMFSLRGFAFTYRKVRQNAISSSVSLPFRVATIEATIPPATLNCHVQPPRAVPSARRARAGVAGLRRVPADPEILSPPWTDPARGGRCTDGARQCDAVQSRSGFSPLEQHIRGLHANVYSLPLRAGDECPARSNVELDAN